MKGYLKLCLLVCGLLILTACAAQRNTVRVVETTSISGHSIAVGTYKANPLGVFFGVLKNAYILYNPQDGTQPDTFLADIEKATWSPDGQWIASTKYVNDSLTLYLIHPDRQQETLVASADPKSWPVFSPDGKQIAYTKKTNDKKVIYIVNISCPLEANENETCVFEPVFLVEGESPSWSPDGKSIVYNTPYGEEERKIYIIDTVDTTEAFLLIEDGYYPQWSPNSDKILFKSDSEHATLEEGIYTIYANGTQLTQLTEEIGYKKISWSPDGEFITFASQRDSRCVYGCGTDNYFHTSALYQMTADGENLTRLTLADDEYILWHAWIPSQDN